MTDLLDPRSMIAIVDRILQANGAVRVAVEESQRGDSYLSAAYEDNYSFIGVAYFISMSNLIDHWLDAQEELERLTSRAIVHLGAKAWDGYLVLLTEQPISRLTMASVTAIRSNTRQLRKLVIARDDLAADKGVSLESTVGRSLTPLLPLTVPRVASFVDPVSTLPDRLKVVGLSRDDIEAVVIAHSLGLPMIATLHTRISGTENSP